MILKHDLNKNIEQIVHENMTSKEEVIYAMPFDIDKFGQIIEHSYLIVSKSRVLVIENAKLKYNLFIEDLAEFKLVKSGDTAYIYAIAKANTNASRDLSAAEEEVFVLRVTGKYKIQMSYIAKGVELLISGEDIILVSKEREKYCPRCHNALANSNRCRHCSKDKGITIKRVWQIAKDYKLQFVFLFIPILFASLASIAQRFVERYFIDNVLLSGRGTAKDIIIFFLITAILLVATIVAAMFRTYVSNEMGAKISESLRNRVYIKLNQLPVSFIDQYDAGQLMNRVMSDTDHIRRFITDVGGQMLNLIFVIIIVAIVMFMINWKLALISLIFFPFALLITRLTLKNYKRFRRREVRWKDISDAQLQDAISGIRIVKSFGQEDRESKQYIANTNKLAEYTQESEKYWAIFSPLLTFAATAGGLLLIGVGGYAVIKQTLTVGELTQMIAYSSMMYGELNFLTRLPRMLTHLNTALDRIYEILDEEIVLSKEEKHIDQVLGNIKFDNVDFGYNSYDPILKNISADIKAGEKIGIVGKSGAGKSTFVNLIMRLYQVDSGEITLDGTNISHFAYDSYHKKLGVVLQESYLFSGTIAENLKFAKPEASMSEIIYAAKLANAHDFICKMPDAYDTYVGEKGNRLSGGEKQRIAIARALLPNPSMLILDEPTSSLDLETEVLIQEALERLTEGKTTFIIAHRLATLKNCDRILVIDNHRIAEFGSHKELMSSKGIYYDLVLAQLDLFQMEEISNV